MEQAGRVRKCPNGCAGDLTAIPGSREAPTFWARVRQDGQWACSKDPPAPPGERLGILTYACSGCRCTLRTVEELRASA
jgi:hypothetical protein